MMAAALLVVGLTACGDNSSRGANSPRSVVEEAIKCLTNEDYRGYWDCVYFSKDQMHNKEAMISMSEAEVKSGNSLRRKIVSYKFVSEDINEDAGLATETFELTYNDGITKTVSYKAGKQEGERWYVELEQ